MSVSRRARPPHFGHDTFTKSATCASGESPRPVKFVTLGSSTGSCSYGTGTIPHVSQYTIGIGVPQYRWREIPQSFRRNCTVRLPMPCLLDPLAHALTSATSEVRPVNSPESTRRPYSSKAWSMIFGVWPRSGSGCTTTFTGSLYFVANSKSR